LLEKKKAADAMKKPKRTKQEISQARADKEAIKTIPQLEAEAQRDVNRYVRLRDAGMECPSCGKPEAIVIHEQGHKVGGAHDAGHFRSRGAAKQLRFNLLNIWRQCKSCNAGEGKFSHKSETVTMEYERWLIAKIGIERVEKLKNNHDIVRYKADYLRRMRDIFRRRANRLKKRRDAGITGPHSKT
jgi:hypothetical protein